MIGRQRSDVHDENWCSEGQNNGELGGHDHVEFSMFDSFLYLDDAGQETLIITSE